MKEVLLLVTTIVALFSTTLLRSFQNKSVAAGHKKFAFCVGTIMSACDLIVMGMVAHAGNIYLMLIGAVGSGLGWVAGMILHDRLMRKKVEEQKRIKKKKRNSRIRDLSREEIDDRLQELGLI